MSDAALSLIILGVTVVLFVINRLPVGGVAIGSALALYFTGLISVEAMTSGFGATVIVFIAALFVVSEGLEASGITAWFGQMMSRIAGTTAPRVLAAVMVLGALLIHRHRIRLFRVRDCRDPAGRRHGRHHRAARRESSPTTRICHAP